MSYREKRAEQAQTVQALACIECGAFAEWKTLSMYGARCRKCFARYAYGGSFPSGPNDDPMSREEKVGLLAHLKAMLKRDEPSKEWAHRLKAREESGGELSSHQRWAWRSALRERAKVDQ